MRILFCSYAFSPSVGGLETASQMLASAFAQAGHEVTLVTQTAESDDIAWPFVVVRQPRLRALWSLTRWAEMIFQNNLSLRLLWPAFALAKPRLVTTQTWLSGVLGAETKFSRLKRAVLRRCRNVAISRAVAQHLGLPSIVLGNPYDDQTFRPMAGRTRAGELLFVGRLVSDKGLALLIAALCRLRTAGLVAALTVVGDGPERAACEEQARTLGVHAQVTFRGVARGAELAEIMNSHRVLVVPSRWAEPFGIVALEGVACGCLVIGSQDGGLPEAIGPCGLIFPNGNEAALAETLRQALSDPAVAVEAQQFAELHLSKFCVANVAEKYLKLFQEAMA